eukprot:GHVS01061442.1.p1 GENE.GHVS01061442.1~~GHVS01061442.1.p1  ORF type:complete len:191 (+),score=28.71 GHVS01061442.1:119-691(+)
MEEVLDELSRAVSGGGGDVSEDQLHEAYRTVSKLCTNILKNRTEKKYRTIKKSNGSIRSKLLLDSKPPLCDLLTKLLEELGFTDLEDSFVFVSDDAEAFENLCHNADILQGIMASLDIAPVKQCSTNGAVRQRGGPKGEEDISTPTLRTPKANNGEPRSFKRPNDDVYKKTTNDVRDIREEQARRYKRLR